MAPWWLQEVHLPPGHYPEPGTRVLLCQGIHSLPTIRVAWPEGISRTWFQVWDQIWNRTLATFGDATSLAGYPGPPRQHHRMLAMSPQCLPRLPGQAGPREGCIFAGTESRRNQQTKGRLYHASLFWSQNYRRKKSAWGLGTWLVVEFFPCMHKALVQSPAAQKQNTKTKTNQRMVL